jgi:hypothetical protein
MLAIRSLYDSKCLVWRRSRDRVWRAVQGSKRTSRIAARSIVERAGMPEIGGSRKPPADIMSFSMDMNFELDD